MKQNLAVWALFGLAFVANPALLSCQAGGRVHLDEHDAATRYHQLRPDPAP